MVNGMAKVRLLARIMRALFNGLAIGIFGTAAIYFIGKAIMLLNALTSEEFLSILLLVFGGFLTGSIGIELSKDIEATEKME